MGAIKEFLKLNKWKIIITLGMSIGAFGLGVLLQEFFYTEGVAEKTFFISYGVYTKLYTIFQWLNLLGIVIPLWGLRGINVYLPAIFQWPLLVIVNLISYYLLSCLIYFIFATAKGRFQKKL